MGVAQLPVAHVHTKSTPKGVKRPSVTSGSHGTTTKKKNAGEKAGHVQNILPVRTASGHATLSLPVKKTPLGRILRNFMLRMRRTYFRTGHVTDVSSGHVTDVTSGHVTSGSTTANTTLSVPICQIMISYLYQKHI